MQRIKLRKNNKKMASKSVRLFTDNFSLNLVFLFPSFFLQVANFPYVLLRLKKETKSKKKSFSFSCSCRRIAGASIHHPITPIHACVPPRGSVPYLHSNLVPNLAGVASSAADCILFNAPLARRILAALFAVL